MNTNTRRESGPRNHPEPASHHHDTRTTGPDQPDRRTSVAPEPWILPRLRHPAPGAHGQQVPTVLKSKIVRDAYDEGKRRVVERRARVLRHEDLRAALKDAGFQPECWNGYVPPEIDSYGRRNDSPWRADLVDICTEAKRREEELGLVA